tara:strand:- start:2172 stop:3896 length:1725 start_codon:yes stop_codon:yes gene_type:complete
MNIFEFYREYIIKILKNLSEDGSLSLPDSLDGINVDIPPLKFDCDLSSNAALILSKINNKKPNDVANLIISKLSNENNIESISIANPGFINIKLKKIFWSNFLTNVISNKNFGKNNKHKKKKYLIEFVSANPTGPLHVGHCRGAVLGDVLSNLLLFNENIVTKEYYVNDFGGQISHFTKSVFLRIREILYKEKYPTNDKNLYPGEYVINIANNIINNSKKLNFDNYENIFDELTKISVQESLKIIKFNLQNLGITHDNFVSERDLSENKEVDNVIKKLKDKNFVYIGKIKAPQSEDNSKWIERDQLLFKSTDFGDDKDRALQKEDKSWTYFAGDVAYHNNKLNRKFDVLINILGADHAGYIKRITSVVEAISGEKNKLICKVSQLVKLIKDNKPFKMSKRKGDYITVEDLISEVGKDATRFIMLNRSSDVELDFDFSKVKEKSKDNHLYYIQYCYARISSIFRNTNIKIDEKMTTKDFNFEYAANEIQLIKKISEWPKCIEVSTFKLEPHRIPTYLYELSSEFHSYWNLGRDDKSKRFIDNGQITKDKLILLKSMALVIKSGLNILGVDSPEKM